MALEQRILPTEVNLDLSPLYLGSDKARFIRNLDFTSFGGEKEGENEGVIRRLQTVDRYDDTFALPQAEGYTTIFRVATPENNELFVGNHHAAGRHCIYRIRGGACELVFEGPELEFTLDPEHFLLGAGRIAVFRFTKGETIRTFLVFTDSNVRQHMLCVEDSIATNSFNAIQFPRLAGVYDRRELISLGVISPTDCIGITPVPTTADDARDDLMKRATWQWRLQYYDVYGRPSEHGPVSEIYYTSECATIKSRCVDLTFTVGNPLVQRVAVEYRKNCIGEWSRHDLLELRTNCDKPWYEQGRNPDLQYNPDTNKITYRFCADKGCVAVPDVETDRVENPLPQTSESAFIVGGDLGLAGNRYGFKPFACDLLDKVKFSVEKPTVNPQSSEALQTRNIVVWAYIYGPNQDEQPLQAIWNNGGVNVFGGINNEDVEERVGSAFGQRFSDADQEGFIGFLHGTGYTTISKQYRLGGLSEEERARVRMLGRNYTTTNGNWTEHGVATRNEAQTEVFMQRFEFKNVPPGTYIFRIANHRAALNEDYKATSTYYYQNKAMNGKLPSMNPTGVAGRELVVNVCQKNYDTMSEGGLAVEIWDLTHGKNTRRGDIFNPGFEERAARATDGYVYETESEGVGRVPIAGAQITMDVSGDSDEYYVRHTDHNGFFFTTAKDKKHAVNIDVIHLCQRSHLGEIVWHRSEDGGTKRYNFIATKQWADFETEPCNRIPVSGRVVDCATGAPLENIVVAMRAGGATTTDRDGRYTLLTHDFEYNDIERTLLFYGGTCRVRSCDGNVCLPTVDFFVQECTSCAERPVLIGDVRLLTDTGVQRGPQLGGRYKVALKGGDWMDRKNFAQTHDAYYLDIPTAAEIGGFAFPRIRWTIDADARFPQWMERLYFNISKNLSFSDFLTWVVDRFEFIDNTGYENKIAPTQIRIHYSSLAEYNKQHAFSTNSTWQFIDEKDSLRITDTVQFIANGNGALFQKPISGLVRFDKDGQFFLIDYTAELKDLEEGALIRLVRPYECRDSEVFFELCDSVPIINGVPLKREGYLLFHDSYFVGRQIPTPVVTTKKIQKSSTDSAGTVTIIEEEESTTTNTIRAYGWPFEHHSPSDFWGTKCGTFGRPSVANNLEDVILKGDEIALSGVLGTNSLANYLHYFDDKRKTSFGREYDIIACIPKGNRLLAICSATHFVVPFDDNTVRMDESGRAVLVSADRQFGKPQTAGEPYGCRRADRNTITYAKERVHWIDGNNIAEVLHNFQAGQDVSNGRFKSFLRRKIKAIDRINTDGRTLKDYLHSHINPKNGQCYISHFSLLDKSYITDTDSPQSEGSDTYCIDLASGALRKFCSFTPETFASLAGDTDEDQFFSFKGGLPFKHYRTGSSSSDANNFYGVQCSDYLRFAFTADPLLIHQFTSIEVYSDNVILWGSDVTTGFKQKSKIPRNWFDRGDRYYVAPFLCDIKNNPKILFGGERMRGRYIEVLLQSDPDKRHVYNELTAIKINAIKP